jgi:mono/diheme cytochrome c family protein
MVPVRTLSGTMLILSLFLWLPGTGLGNDEGRHEEHEHEAVPHEAAQRENPVPATDDSMAAGRLKFTTFCVGCHGASGKGDGPMAKKLSDPPADLTRSIESEPGGKLHWIIENGYGQMPPWKSVLTESDAWNILNYLKTLSR